MKPGAVQRAAPMQISVLTKWCMQTCEHFSQDEITTLSKHCMNITMVKTNFENIRLTLHNDCLIVRLHHWTLKTVVINQVIYSAKL